MSTIPLPVEIKVAAPPSTPTSEVKVKQLEQVSEITSNNEDFEANIIEEKNDKEKKEDSGTSYDAAVDIHYSAADVIEDTDEHMTSAKEVRGLRSRDSMEDNVEENLKRKAGELPVSGGLEPAESKDIVPTPHGCTSEQNVLANVADQFSGNREKLELLREDSNQEVEQASNNYSQDQLETRKGMDDNAPEPLRTSEVEDTEQVEEEKRYEEGFQEQGYESLNAELQELKHSDKFDSARQQERNKALSEDQMQEHPNLEFLKNSQIKVERSRWSDQDKMYEKSFNIETFVNKESKAQETRHVNDHPSEDSSAIKQDMDEIDKQENLVLESSKESQTQERNIEQRGQKDEFDEPLSVKFCAELEAQSHETELSDIECKKAPQKMEEKMNEKEILDSNHGSLKNSQTEVEGAEHSEHKKMHEEVSQAKTYISLEAQSQETEPFDYRSEELQKIKENLEENERKENQFLESFAKRQTEAESVEKPVQEETNEDALQIKTSISLAAQSTPLNVENNKHILSGVLEKEFGEASIADQLTQGKEYTITDKRTIAREHADQSDVKEIRETSVPEQFTTSHEAEEEDRPVVPGEDEPLAIELAETSNIKSDIKFMESEETNASVLKTLQNMDGNPLNDAAVETHFEMKETNKLVQCVELAQTSANSIKMKEQPISNERTTVEPMTKSVANNSFPAKPMVDLNTAVNTSQNMENDIHKNFSAVALSNDNVKKVEPDKALVDKSEVPKDECCQGICLKQTETEAKRMPPNVEECHFESSSGEKGSKQFPKIQGNEEDTLNEDSGMFGKPVNISVSHENIETTAEHTTKISKQAQDKTDQLKTEIAKETETSEQLSEKAEVSGMTLEITGGKTPGRRLCTLL